MAIDFTGIDFLGSGFDNAVYEYQRYADRKTGFENLDDVQVFSPGLYVLGGLPGAGKSTFALQLLYQLAVNGEQCYFFSFEMSTFALWSKVLARELYVHNKCGKKVIAMTATDLQRGHSSGKQEIYDLKWKLSQSGLPLKIAYVSSISAKAFMKELPKEEGAVICIDYLQIMSHDKENQRGAIDETVFSFREYQQETNSTLLILSSFNRDSYRQRASLSSFKESGGVEYTADVCWAIEANGVGADGKFDPEIARRESRKAERHVQLSCLKNRFGGQYEVNFNYIARHDCFREMPMPMEEDNPDNRSKGKHKK